MKDILPEIYEVQEWKKEEGVEEKWEVPRTGTPTDTIFAIEMEKLVKEGKGAVQEEKIRRKEHALVS